MSFTLHVKLAKDAVYLGNLTLCQVLLMNDSQFPWLILVPERENITEIHELSADDQLQLMRESCYMSEKLAEVFQADKMNVAALGNIVTQLHVHHVVRYETDKAWPAPIWGKFETMPYSAVALDKLLIKINNFIMPSIKLN